MVICTVYCICDLDATNLLERDWKETNRHSGAGLFVPMALTPLSNVVLTSQLLIAVVGIWKAACAIQISTVATSVRPAL